MKNGTIEDGYHLKFFDLDKDDFKYKIWRKLKKMLKLKCAFIKTEDYRGCILNWPNVFTKSNCKTVERRG